MRVTVTVYSTPNCQRCHLTCLALERAGIAYTVVDITENAAARVWITDELGYAELPVVVVDQDPENHWCGLRDQKIRELARLNSWATSSRASIEHELVLRANVMSKLGAGD